MTSPDDDRDLDRLVDGELDDEARRNLLARLDATPEGWRRCALAFLEAQALRQALAPLACSTPAAPPVGGTSTRRRIAPWAARAAAVLVAFGLGWAVGAPGREVPPGRVVYLPAPMAHPAPTPGRPSPVMSRLSTEPPAAPGYIRGRLEREGYRVEQKLLLVPASTRDGRQYVVPVERVEVRYVGNRAV